MGEIFQIGFRECEKLANKAGLSLHKYDNAIVSVVSKYDGKYIDLQRKASVSERMFQYYMSGTKLPSKEVLLALSISMELPVTIIHELLYSYGYCLSKSLPSDAVILWGLDRQNMHGSGVSLLQELNEILLELELPMLMTKNYN